ncbi:MAG: nucleotide sugar dehydrogenase [Phycisphaeraceae bacterium]|nr:MAG: nucleotide sugar dehydrogenase [Phycisphaeraceae bacterium]
MKTLAHDLRQRLQSRDALVAVVGLGYVGLPLLAAFHRAGFRVLGIDTDPAKPDALRRGLNYLPHLGDDLARPFASGQRFEATTDHARLADADAVVVCVPTPLGPHHEPDLSYVTRTARDIGRHARPGVLVVLESTSYPGTTRHDLLPALLDASPSPRTPGVDLFVAFSPEREDPGRTTHTTRTIPKLVGGLDDPSRDLAVALYSGPVDTVIPVASAEVAEAAKILENVFRAVNIALVNEVKTILEPMGVDVWEVIDAAATKPFGFMPFYPGPGLGGHCIPIDPYYLAWKAREHHTPARFIELAGEINTAMPARVIDRLARALSDRGTPVKDARVLVLGLAYKPDIADVRESPSLELIRLLKDRGARVEYSDPHVPRTHRMRRHDLVMASVPLTPKALADADAVLIATHHSAFDYAAVARHARLVIDTRNAMAPYAREMGDRLVRA